MRGWRSLASPTEVSCPCAFPHQEAGSQVKAKMLEVKLQPHQLSVQFMLGCNRFIDEYKNMFSQNQITQWRFVDERLFYRAEIGAQQKCT